MHLLNSLRKASTKIINLVKSIIKHEATSKLIAVKLSIALLFAVLAAPNIHNKYLLKNVGKSIVKLHVPSRHGSGGTGYHIKAPDGKVYLMTNRHVCELAENGILEAEYKGGFYPLKVIKIAAKTDLCLMEGIKGAKGLRLASSNQEFADDVYSVGHPLLDDLTLSKGQVGNVRDIELLNEDANTKEECEAAGDKMKEVTVNTPFGAMRLALCITSIKGQRTTAIIFPGSSGSPILRWDGAVVGTAFAADNRTNYGEMIPVEVMIKFLKEECNLRK